MPVLPPYTFDDYVAAVGFCCCVPPHCSPPSTLVWEKSPFIEHCGYAANATHDYPDPTPDETVGFDWSQVPSVPIPLYLHKESYYETQYHATYSGSWVKHATPGASTPPDSLEETLSRTREISYTESISSPSEYGKTPWDWDATNIPFDRCDGSGTNAPEPVTGISASLASSTPEYDGEGNLTGTLYTVSVSWTDNRPEDPANPGVKLGTFALIVNGTGVLSTDEDHAEFATHTSGCVLIQVQHIHSSTGFGGVGNGTISSPQPFYIRTEEETEDGPCTVPAWSVCSASAGPSNSSDPTATHETWSQTGTYDGDAVSGSGTECDPYPDNPPPSFGGWGGWSLGDLVSSSSGNVSESQFEAEFVYHYEYSGSFTPDPASHYWQAVSDEREADTTIREGYVLSSLLAATPETMFGEAVTKLSTITESTDLGSGYPVTKLVVNNFETPRFPSSTGSRSLRYDRRSFKWVVPDDHIGSYFSVAWDVMLVPYVWMVWRNEYYQWALDKYAFLNRPEPGDPDYPKLEDFFDDPDTPEDERVAALADAIAALPSDPGDAPEAPAESPELAGSNSWSTSSLPPFNPSGDNSGRRSGEYELTFTEYKKDYSLQLANVSYKCYQDPNGSPYERRVDFLTYPLPDLDPAAFDPATYQDWWGGGILVEP
jgi:hypothetical protein